MLERVKDVNKENKTAIRKCRAVPLNVRTWWQPCLCQWLQATVSRNDRTPRPSDDSVECLWRTVACWTENPTKYTAKASKWQKKHQYKSNELYKVSPKMTLWGLSLIILHWLAFESKAVRVDDSTKFWSQDSVTMEIIMTECCGSIFIGTRCK